MPYVQVPKDLSRVKSKIIMGLTQRQAICFGAGAIMGVPVFFLTREIIGNSPAVLLMMFVMLPAFFLAMYEKNGLPAEKILFNVIRCRWFPAKRPYKIENFYSTIDKEENIDFKNKKTNPTGKTTGTKHLSSKGKQKKSESNA